MAGVIEFFTGFEGCGSDADVWALADYLVGDEYVGYSAPQGYNNGKCLALRNTPFGYFGVYCSAAKTKVAGGHVKSLTTSTNTTSAGAALIRFVGPDIRLINYGNNDLRLYRGTTQIGASGAPHIPSSLAHIEMKVFSHATAGTVQVRLNGTLIMDQSNLDTGGQDITAVTFGGMATNYHYKDNLFISSDWEGELVSHLLRPASDSSVQFTPSTGTDNFALLDELASDGDSTYVSSGTVDQQDLYGYADLPADKTPVAVQIVTVARKDDAGERTLAVLAHQGSTDYPLQTVTLASAYPAIAGSAAKKCLPTCPDATAWDRTKLNALTWGFKVAS